MSILRKIVREAVPPPAWGFSAWLSEAHHKNKKDSPSGSAIELRRLLEAAGYRVEEPEAIRAGGIVGEHTVRLVSDTEEVILQHRVFDRKVFAKGALLAAARLATVKTPGLYTWDELFEEKVER